MVFPSLPDRRKLRFTVLALAVSAAVGACQSPTEALTHSLGIPVVAEGALEECSEQALTRLTLEVASLPDQRKAELKSRLSARYTRIVIHPAIITELEYGAVTAKRLRKKACGSPRTDAPDAVENVVVLKTQDPAVKGALNSHYEERGGELHILFSRSDDLRTYTYLDFVIGCGDTGPVDEPGIRARYTGADTPEKAAALADAVSRQTGGNPACQSVERLDRYLGL